MGLLVCMEQNKKPEDKKEERMNGKEGW